MGKNNKFLIILFASCFSLFFLACCASGKEYGAPHIEKALPFVDSYIVKWQNRGVPAEFDYSTYKLLEMSTNYDYDTYRASSYEISKLNTNEIYYKMGQERPTDCRLAFDKDTNSYWKMEDVGIDQYVLFNVNLYGPFKENNGHYIKRKDGAPYRIEICAGNQNKFSDYSRPKKIIFEVYETLIRFKNNPEVRVGYEMFVTNGSLLIYQKEFQLKDQADYQGFDLKLPDMTEVYGPDHEELENGYLVHGGKVCRLVVKEVYPGKIFNNTCIAEIRFKYE